MLDTLVEILKNSGVTAWELKSVRERGWEFYFIRHALDQHRVKDVEQLTVKVFQLTEDGSSLGFASAELPQSATREEAEKLVKDLAYRASLVKNRPYTLRASVPVAAPPSAEIDVPGIARAFLEAVRSVPETAGEDLNSYELFVSEKTRRFLNSAGTDVSERWPESMLEVVVNAREDGHEIELYRNYLSGGCDADALRADLARTMRYGRDRLRAVPTPALGTADVLFSGKDAASLYEYFADRTSAQYIYFRFSDWELGKPVADGIRGDRVTMKAVRELPNSSRNRVYDGEGAPIRDVTLLEGSVPVQYLGSRMFSSYLGLEDSFIPTNFVVSGGTHSDEALRSGPYLEAVEFSDFQVDAMTGDIFGELRLGYWHDGKTVTPVTGGSVSGSMGDFVKDMAMSVSTAQYDNMRIPALTLLRGVTVTGAAGE